MDHIINLTEEEINLILVWGDTHQSECDFNSEDENLYLKLSDIKENLIHNSGTDKKGEEEISIN